MFFSTYALSHSDVEFSPLLDVIFCVMCTSRVIATRLTVILMKFTNALYTTVRERCGVQCGHSNVEP